MIAGDLVKIPCWLTSGPNNKRAIGIVIEGVKGNSNKRVSGSRRIREIYKGKNKQKPSLLFHSADLTKIG